MVRQQLDVLLVACNAVFTLSRLSFYGVQLLEQLYNVASLSGPTGSLQCYSLLLLYCRQIIDDDDYDADDELHSRQLTEQTTTTQIC